MTAACLLLLVAGVSHVSAQSDDGSGQGGSSIEQVQTSRAEELLAKRRERLANVTPAKPSAAVDFLATAETDGFDQLVSLHLNYAQIRRSHRRWSWGGSGSRINSVI